MLLEGGSSGITRTEGGSRRDDDAMNRSANEFPLVANHLLGQ